jgi:hypothetical protein
MSSKPTSTVQFESIRTAKTVTAADDMGQSKHPAMRPVLKKIAPLLVNNFQKGMKQLSPSARKKVITTYFGRVDLNDQPTSKKNMKMMRDILVKALIQDRGWLEFIAEQILDGSTKELAALLDKTVKTSSTHTAAFMKPEYWKGTMYEAGSESNLYPADQFTKEQVAEQEDCDPADIQTQTGVWARLSAPGYTDATDWSGPFESQVQAQKYIEEQYDVDALTGDDLDDTVHEASVERLAGYQSLDSIFEGQYPMLTSNFSNVAFPFVATSSLNSKAWTDVRAAARSLGFVKGSDIYLKNATQAVDLFAALETRKDAAERRALRSLHMDARGSGLGPDAFMDDYFEREIATLNDPAYELAKAMGL